VRINCVLSDAAKIAANLDMYRNFFAMLVWHSHSACADQCEPRGQVSIRALFGVNGNGATLRRKEESSGSIFHGRLSQLSSSLRSFRAKQSVMPWRV